MTRFDREGPGGLPIGDDDVYSECPLCGRVYCDHPPAERPDSWDNTRGDDSVTKHTYGNIDGYKPQSFEEIDLDKLRTGRSACNPAEALLLVKKIDELQAPKVEPDLSKLVVDPEREALGIGTGFFVRAKHPTDGWGNHDIFALTTKSLLLWLSSRPNAAEQVLLALLNHPRDIEPAHDPTNRKIQL